MTVPVPQHPGEQPRVIFLHRSTQTHRPPSTTFCDVPIRRRRKKHLIKWRCVLCPGKTAYCFFIILSYFGCFKCRNVNVLLYTCSYVPEYVFNIFYTPLRVVIHWADKKMYTLLYVIQRYCKRFNICREKYFFFFCSAFCFVF